MEEGFVIDNVRVAHGVSRWAPGKPQESFLTGTKSPSGTLPLTALRCSSCGHTELYARKDS
jgi:hypothetical protein